LDGADIRRLEVDALVKYQQNLLAPELRTPVKRGFFAVNETGLPSPQTESRQQPLTGKSDVASGKRRMTDADFLNLVSPATTPSPLRFRDAGTGTAGDCLFMDIKQTLATHGVNLDPETSNAVRDVCDLSTLRTQGISKG
jgi:hypothetical protein